MCDNYNIDLFMGLSLSNLFFIHLQAISSFASNITCLLLDFSMSQYLREILVIEISVWPQIVAVPEDNISVSFYLSHCPI